MATISQTLTVVDCRSRVVCVVRSDNGDNLQIDIHENLEDHFYRLIVRDLDSGNILPSVPRHKSWHAAVEHAVKIADGRIDSGETVAV